MEVSKKEILHIANLASLKLKDEETEEYIKNLQDILNFANIVNQAPIEGLDVANGGAYDTYNVFRKDEIQEFEDKEALLANAPEKEDSMFKIPQVL